VTSQRKKASEKRLRAFWAAKESRARKPIDHASLAWDKLRYEVRNLPDGREDDAWREVTRRLDGFRSEFTGSSYTSPSTHPGGRAA
jgi:hypothetical protein